jgi:hypothetical protein
VGRGAGAGGGGGVGVYGNVRDARDRGTVTYMSLVAIKLLRRVPERRYKWAAAARLSRWYSCKSPCTMRGR